MRSAVVTLLFGACVALAQQAPSSTPAKRVVVQAGRLLDVKTGHMLSNQTIVIEGDRIVSVGSATPAAGDQVIALPNATVLPGLIDVHTHLTFEPGDLGMRILTTTPARDALSGAKNARLTLEAGFTTVRNVGARAYSDVALRDAINAGDIPGPRILASGPALSITGGHFDENLLAPQYHDTSDGVADGIEAVQRKVRETSSMALTLSRCARPEACSPRETIRSIRSTRWKS
jgi:imidazolonepropionase-like amidohydrolase